MKFLKQLVNLFVLFIILKAAVGNAQAVQDFESESLAKPAPLGDHSQVGRVPASASNYGSKDCADFAFPTAVLGLRNLPLWVLCRYVYYIL